MLKVKRTMTKESEEKVVNIILEQVRENNMTISNLEEVTAKVANHLESNATLEKEVLKKKVATLEGQVQGQLKVKISISNLKEFNYLVNQAMENVDKIKNFKFEAKHTI